MQDWPFVRQYAQSSRWLHISAVWDISIAQKKRMPTMEQEQGSGSRRSFVKKLLYIPPAIATLKVLPAFATSGSGRDGKDGKYGHDGKDGKDGKHSNSNGFQQLQQILQNRKKRGWS
jgi:hypothetical protein